MHLRKELAGNMKYEIEEFVEPIYLREMNLEYYLIESEVPIQDNNSLNVYGIQVVKTEMDKSNSVIRECEFVPNISPDKDGVKKILDKLIRNKVTPIALHDVLDDFSRIIN